MSFRSPSSLQRLSLTETLDLPTGLSLAPRLKLLLTIFRTDPSPKPIDEWQIKASLLDFLKISLSLSVADDDVQIRRSTDLKKRKREDSVASGTLVARDLGFLKKSKEKKVFEDDERESEKILDKRFLEWRKSVVDRMDSMELNIEGVKFRLGVEVPAGDDFDRVRQAWEENHELRNYNRGYYSRGARQQPDTLVLEGLPSRWFAEPRVSSKPSMLVSHTIFSVFGKIRNLNVAGDDDLAITSADEKGGRIMSGLQCKIRVQFEKHDDFCNAIRVLCGRSMQKEGSRLKADYDVTWDKEGFFRSVQQRLMGSRIQEKVTVKDEAPTRQSELLDGVRPKRFRVRVKILLMQFLM